MSRALLRQADRLVAVQVLSTILLVWAVLLGFDVLVAFLSDLKRIGEGSFTGYTALLKSLYTVPRRMYELFPHSAMIGCVLGLGALAATSELTALRAAGLSKLRICGSAILCVGTLTALMVVSGETLGPWGELRSHALSASARSKDVAMASWSGLWAREGDTYLNARRGRVEGEAAQSKVILDDVQLYEFDPQGRLRSIAKVTQAVHQDERWTLHQVRRSTIGRREVQTDVIESEIWDSQLKPELLSLSLQRPRYLSTRTLSESLDYLERNSLDPGPFLAAYWSRWFYPLNALVLCLAAMPFAFGTLRSGGFGKRLFLGLVFGLTYFLLQRLTIDLAQLYRVDLRMANLLPPSVVAMAVWLHLRRAV
ncbi:LPS export ABC transporter permease LptG [Pseudomarimonas arenosa]|uniref:LPS export ABC transporter permease LptG n=1 Tax=Pseudomarimonas arenosa TaxID=2774145 RepID=A0AAW3ZKU0_9GAMM|nr:LPS export ABC transporter permease LptG [Pseudomarimonas arenosa]MBD8525056.1 LPS export ABC transporter permease LptG [Pseudomarimonas arenosa]